MVRGCCMVVTSVPGRYQCAETHTIARGRGMLRPSARQPSVQALVCNAFIGLPWPKKIAGMRMAAGAYMRRAAAEGAKAQRLKGSKAQRLKGATAQRLKGHNKRSL